MGAITSILTSALVSQGVGVLSNHLLNPQSRKQDQAVRQLQNRQALSEQQRAADTTLEKQRLVIDAKASEEERKKALRRAVSRQRANFGAQGISAGAGSSQAVLLGLFEESNDERQRREELDTLRINAIDQNLTQGRSLNVLQRTQLQERNKLNRISTRNNIITNLF